MANVLTGIGAPRSYGNILTLLGWAAKENTKAKNNPLATTAGWIKNADGSDPTFFNTISKEGEPRQGVRNYDNPLTGVEATVATFLQMDTNPETGEETFRYYGPVVELLRKGTTDKEVLADPGAVKAIQTWGSFAPKKDSEGNVIRDENGEIVYSNNWGSRPQWGATEKELKSLGYTKTGQTDDAFVEDFTEWAKTEPSLPAFVTESPVTFAEDLIEAGADVEQWPDIQNPDFDEPVEPDLEEVTGIEEVDGPLNPFGAIPSEHDPDVARSLAEGIASGELVGGGPALDNVEGGIPESWMDKELVDQRQWVPDPTPTNPDKWVRQSTPRQQKRGTGSTGAESVFFEDVVTGALEGLYSKAAEILGVSGTVSGDSRLSTVSEKVLSAWESYDEQAERLANAEDIAQQTLQLFETKAQQHRGGRAVVDDEDRKLLFALIGEGRGGRSKNVITGLSIASPELIALYNNKDATYAEVLAELRGAPAFARSLAQQSEGQAGDLSSIMDTIERIEVYNQSTEKYTGMSEKEILVNEQLKARLTLEAIQEAGELLDTDEFSIQLDNLAEPGVFDRQAERGTPEFVHALVVDEHLSPPLVGAMGPPNAPSYTGGLTYDVPVPSRDGTKAGKQSLKATGPEGIGALEGATDTSAAGDTKTITDEAMRYIAEEFGGSTAFYNSLGKKLWVDVEGDEYPPMHILKYLAKTGESNEEEIWRLFASTEWFGEIDATGRDFQEKWHLIGGKAGWVPILDDDNMSWNMNPDMLAELDSQYDILIREAERLGIPTDDPRKKEALMQMAYNAKLTGMDGFEIRQEFLENLDLSFNRQAVTESSTFGAIRANLKQRSGKYMLRLSDQAIDDYAQSIYLGEITYDALDAGFMEQAKTNNPAITSLIDQGYTPSAYFSSYAGIASQLLERPVDFMSGQDSRMFGVLTGRGQTDDGNQRILSRNEFERYIRSQPEWETTDNGRNAAYSTVSNLLGSFGFPGYN